MLEIGQTLGVKCIAYDGTLLVGAASGSPTLATGVFGDATGGITGTFTATKGAVPSNSYVAAAGSTVLTRPIKFAAATAATVATPGTS
jgi:hypothetical protein